MTELRVGMVLVGMVMTKAVEVVRRVEQVRMAMVIVLKVMRAGTAAVLEVIGTDLAR